MSEIDPNGIGQHEPGAKLDEGKPRLARVLKQFPRALRAVAVVGMDGAAKYTWDGWFEVPDGIERYDDALMRHAIPEDGDYCPISGTLHKAHAAWNALAELELELKAGKPLKDTSQSTLKRREPISEEELDRSTLAPVEKMELSEAGDRTLTRIPEKYVGRIQLDKISSLT